MRAITLCGMLSFFCAVKCVRKEKGRFGEDSVPALFFMLQMFAYNIVICINSNLIKEHSMYLAPV